MNLHWILYYIPMFIVFTKNLLWLSTLDSSWNDYLFCEFTLNPLCLWQIHLEFIMDSWSVTRSDYESTLDYGNSLFINYLFYKLTLNALTGSWIHNVKPMHLESTIFINSLWIHYLFREFNSRSEYFSWIKVHLGMSTNWRPVIQQTNRMVLEMHFDKNFPQTGKHQSAPSDSVRDYLIECLAINISDFLKAKKIFWNENLPYKKTPYKALQNAKNGWRKWPSSHQKRYWIGKWKWCIQWTASEKSE